jgi:hypothetical protein
MKKLSAEHISDDVPAAATMLLVNEDLPMPDTPRMM